MERIFQLSDTAALLAYCLLRTGEIAGALDTLDRSKARLTRTDADATITNQLAALIPEGGALLFPLFAASEGAVVIVSCDTSTGALRSDIAWLPNFGKPRLLQLQRGPSDRTLGGWLGAYAARDGNPHAWRSEIDAIGGTLYEELWTPVLAVARSAGVTPPSELVWFHQGGSAVLPLHAAWKAEGDARRWLIDDHALRYATSVRALAGSASRGPVSGPTMMVANPTGDLEYTELESVWVQEAIAPDPVIALHGSAAARAAVVDRLASCRNAHFATHAHFDWRDPFSSSIALAHGESLTLSDLMPMLRTKSPELVVLSACETGVTRVTSTPDELLGFPTVFVELGTSAVLATLWPVDDAAAGLLASCFYAECAHGGVSRAEALRRSQQWLRRLTVRDLLAALRTLRSAPSPAGPLAASLATPLRALDQDDRPFAHPWFWAAFSLTGR
jgi:CHAT domain-containing protein